MRRLLSLPFRLLRNILRGLMLRTVADMRGGKKQRYAKEALLRDVHEYTAVWAYLVGAAFLFMASEMALLVPTIAWTGSAIFSTAPGCAAATVITSPAISAICSVCRSTAWRAARCAS